MRNKYAGYAKDSNSRAKIKANRKQFSYLINDNFSIAIFCVDVTQ